MGFTARQVDSLSLWEFAAMVDGWNRAQGGEAEAEGEITFDEFDAMLERHEKILAEYGGR